MTAVCVAIDISPLKNSHRFRGIGFYTKNLTEGLLATIKEDRKYADFKIKMIDEPFDHSNNQSPSLVHYPQFDIFFPTLPRKTRPTIVTVHDLTPLVFPSHYPSGVRGRINWLGQKKKLQKVEAIITDSQNSKKDIARLVNYKPEKIFVVYLGVGESFKKIKNEKIKEVIRQKYCLPRKFVFYVGDVNWNKNIPNLVKACQQVNLPLVIAGKQAISQNYDRNHPENQDLVWLQKMAKNEAEIHLLGYVPDEDLPILYNLASIYCQPSFYEGFGLPLVEAMACGTPVVSANTGSLPEVGEEAVLYFNPYQKNSLFRAIETVIGDKELANKLSARGLLQARKFSWKKCAKETLGVYQNVLSSLEK